MPLFFDQEHTVTTTTVELFKEKLKENEHSK